MNRIILFAFIIMMGCRPQEAVLIGKLEELPLNTIQSGNAQINHADDGEIYLSWLEYENESRVSLRFARLNQTHNKWENERMVNSGVDWFVNWADFPSVVSLGNGSFIAHWLQYSGEGTYDYDIRYSLSHNGGKTWSNPVYLNDTTHNAEYGFVTIKKADERAFVVWLDGRHMTNEGHEEHEHGSGNMNLRAAYINKEGKIEEEVVLDDQTCECCNTEVVIAPEGPVVFYRNKGDGSVRDIHTMRRNGREWHKDNPLHNDGWIINACPVNGPAADGIQNRMAVAWFTGAADSSEVKLKISDDGGKTFGPAIQVKKGEVLGRVDAVVDRKAGNIYVSWIEKRNDLAMLCVAGYNAEGNLIRKYDLTEMNVVRKSGFPKLAAINGDLILAYTEVDADARQRVRTFRVK